LNAPEFAGNAPEKEWVVELDPDRIARMLDDSAGRVRDAIKNRVETGRAMDLDFDHTVLPIQLLIFQEGYHHGQIKLSLKASAARVQLCFGHEDEAATARLHHRSPLRRRMA